MINKKNVLLLIWDWKILNSILISGFTTYLDLPYYLAGAKSSRGLIPLFKAQAMYELGVECKIETQEEARLEATVWFSPMKPIYGGWAGAPQPTISDRGFQRQRTTLSRFQSKNGESLSRVRITHGIRYHQFSQRKFIFLEQCRL